MNRFYILAVIIIASCLQPTRLSAGAAPPPPSDPTKTAASSLEKAIRQEITSQQELVPAYVLFETQIDILDYSPESTWAIAQLISLDPQTGFVIPGEPGLAVAQNTQDGWSITLPNQVGWSEAIAAVPDTLLSPEDKATWLAMYQQASAESTTEFSGFKLPWEAGEKLVLTQSISHYNPPNPAGSMHYAFDFAAWHDASGQSPMFAVHASRGGHVKWARWTQENGDASSPGNYIVIEDTSTNPVSYALYLHLAKDSTPAELRQIGASVSQGQYIGMADDTGYSTGNHLHFQVHTNPTSYWGNSVDITFVDVSINGGRPRTPTEAANWPQYGSQGQLEYTSGNTIPGDSTPPTGGIVTPADKFLLEGSNLELSGWAQDNLALGSVQIKAYYAGTWHNVGSTFTASPFQYTWNVCNDQVPDGPVTLMLAIQDANGNIADGIPGLRRIIKQYECPVPPPACIPNPDQVALFADPGYRGVCTLFGGGTYGSSELAIVGNDNTESVLVGSQMWVTLFNGSQQGRGKTFWADDANLSDDRIGSNRVSSLRVDTRTTSPSTPRMVYPIDGADFPAYSSLSLSWDDLGGGLEFQVKLDGVEKPWQDQTFHHMGSVSPGDHTWQVRGRNASGTSTWSALRTFTIEAPVAAPDTPNFTAPYLDTMENGINGWIRGEWDQTLEENHTSGGGISFNYEINDRIEDYDTGAANSGYLTSPAITIPSTGYALTFWYLYETESPGIYWDQRWVQIAVDGGPFTNILQLHDDPSNFWLKSPPIDLSIYSGHTIQVRFHFETMDAILNAFSGWYIDDVSVDIYIPPECVDVTEPDESPIQAQGVTYNTIVSGDICPQGDVDYFRFTGEAGDRLGIFSRALSAHRPDSYLYLLDEDFSSILAENDDIIPGIQTDAYVTYQLLEDGVYFIKLRAWDHPSAGGSDFDYLLSLYGNDNTAPTATIIAPSNQLYIPHGNLSIEILAGDLPAFGEVATGISHIDFLWHSGDWANSDWVNLGSDWDSSDGWGYNFDTSALLDQRLIALLVQVYDWAGNRSNVALWDLCLGTSACKWHLPIMNR